MSTGAFFDATSEIPLSPFHTLDDLARRFGDLPLERIIQSPFPGTATEDDALRLQEAADKRLCELVDGTLIEKTMGTYESYIACNLLVALSNHVTANKLGIILPADGLLRLRPALIRIPDVCFISRERLKRGKFPQQGIASLIPDIAAEVISRGNSRREMEEKLDDYFGCGVREAWYLYPETKELHRYTARDQIVVLAGSQVITTEILPGFQCEVAPLFLHPSEQLFDDDVAAG